MSTVQLALLVILAAFGAVGFIFSVAPVGLAGAALASTNRSGFRPAAIRFVTTVLDMSTHAGLLCVCVCWIAASGA